MQIRAAVLYSMEAPLPYADSKPLAIEQVELDPPGPGEILVKVAAAGLCHSDLSTINGDRPRPTPMALGHEAAGVVAELGPGGSAGEYGDLKVGDHVVMVYVPSCGSCLPCHEGRPALCEPGAAANLAGTLLSGQRRLRRGSQAIHHHLGVSAFADYAVISRRSAVKIDPDLPLEEAALFGCAVLTGVGAVVNTAGVRPGATVAVVGLGGVGLAALLGAQAVGAGRIVAIDLSDEKLAIAKDLGATDCFNAARTDVVAAVRDLTRGGVQFALEMAGSVAAMQCAFAITRRGGTTVSAGLPHPSQQLSIPLTQMVAEERIIRGSYNGTCVPARDIPNFIALYQRGRLPINRLLTGRLPLDEINAGFDRLHQGKAVRQVVVP